MLKKIIINLEKNGEIYLRIKARPGASKTEIKEILDDDTIKINIAAPPVKGKANQELIKFISRELFVNRNNIKIISGKHEKLKLIKVSK